MIQEAKYKNLIWLLTRITAADNQTISSWTGFNIQIRNDITVVQDIVTYLPTINAPATDMSTVNEVLEKTLSIMQSLHLRDSVCL